MKRLLITLVVLAFPAMLLSGCGTRHSWHQKMTVTVATPAGERSGSAVTEVEVTVGRQFASSTVEQYSVNGEAVIVEVADGKYLFALLANSGPGNTQYLAEHTWGKAIHIDPGLQGLDRLNATYEAFANLNGVSSLPAANYPLLVTFTDIAGPKTVREVKPGNLEAAFGPGYSLRSITLEITDEPVTEGKVLELIPWAVSIKGRIKPIREPIPDGYQPTPEEQIYSISFIRVN